MEMRFSEAIENGCNGTYYNFNRNLSHKGLNESITTENHFTSNDQCGYSFTTHPITAMQDNTVCDQSLCSIYLEEQSSHYYANEFDHEKWKNLRSFDKYGRRFGGNFCRTITTYGWSILIPILLNMIFHIYMFYYDLKNKKVSHVEFISVLLLCYPQWKCVKMLCNYLRHKDEKRLQTEKKTYEREVETLEALAEAGIQVGIFGKCTKRFFHSVLS
jgi:hypothetical protein